jgi:hypothetical protein
VCWGRASTRNGLETLTQSEELPVRDRAWVDIGQEYWDREAQTYGPDHEDGDGETDETPTVEIVITPMPGPVFGPVGEDEIPY